MFCVNCGAGVSFNYGSSETAILCSTCAGDKSIDQKYSDGSAAIKQTYSRDIIPDRRHGFVGFIKVLSWIVLLFSFIIVIGLLNELEEDFSVVDLTWLFLSIPCFTCAYILEFLYDIKVSLKHQKL